MSEIIEVKVFLPDDGLLSSDLERLTIDIKKLARLPPIKKIGDADIKRHIYALHKKGRLEEYSIEDYFIIADNGFCFSFSDCKRNYHLDEVDKLT